MHAGTATVLRCVPALSPAPCPAQPGGGWRPPCPVYVSTRFLGQTYTDGKKFLSHLHNYAGIARVIIGAVAPGVGQLSGPVGSAVGSAVGAGVQALGQYDRLKMEAMNQGNQVAKVGAAIKRGMG